METIYNIVPYDGGYRLLAWYTEDSYDVNGEDITRVWFDDAPKAQVVLDLLAEHDRSDYKEPLPTISWQERAAVEYGDWEPLAREDYEIVPDSEEENSWQVHLATALEGVKSSAEHDWLNWEETDGLEWKLCEATGRIEDYPDGYQPPEG